VCEELRLKEPDYAVSPHLITHMSRTFVNRQNNPFRGKYFSLLFFKEVSAMRNIEVMKCI